MASNKRRGFRRGRPANNIKHFRRQLSIQDKILNADLEVRKSILDAKKQKIEDRKKFPKNKLKNRLNLSSKFKKSRPTIRWTPPDKPSRTGYNFGKTTFGTGFKGKAEYDLLKEFKSLFKLKETGATLAKKLDKKRLELARKTNQLRILNRKDYLYKTLQGGANEFPGQTLATMKDTAAARKYITTDNVVKFTRLGIGAAKTVKNVGAGLVINALSDKYLTPQAEKAGTYLGKKLALAIMKRKKKK